MNSSLQDPAARVAELDALYSQSSACAAHLLCDRHSSSSIAFTLVAPDLSSLDLRYGELRLDSERLAAALRARGVGPGDRIATLMSKSREYLAAVLAIWRLGAVHVPLFTAFAGPAIAFRLTASGARYVFCDAGQRPKLAGDDMPRHPAWTIVTTGPCGAGDLGFEPLLASGAPGLPAIAVGGGAPIVQIFTSGTTGSPKSVLVPLRALASFQTYAEYGLDVRAEDVYFDVESVLAAHSSVAECAVVAAPDAVRGEVLEAFVVLCPGCHPSDELTADLQHLVKRRYAAHAYPRRIHYVESLPNDPVRQDPALRPPHASIGRMDTDGSPGTPQARRSRAARRRRAGLRSRDFGQSYLLDSTAGGACCAPRAQESPFPRSAGRVVAPTSATGWS